MTAALQRFWRGGVPLAEAFWVWGVLGGGVLNLFTTLAAAMLLTLEASPWLAAAVFVAPIPANLALLVGVWRSAGAAAVGDERRFLARAAMAAWAAVLCLL